jgi:hypothetical protein
LSLRCNSIVLAIVILFLSSLAAESTRAQAQPLPGSDVREIYNRLLPQIEQIRAFDNHGHPGFANDTEVDAMEIQSDSSAPLRLRDENTEILDAVKFLFNYPYPGFLPDHRRWLVDQKAAAKAKLGASYFSHILDQVGIETAIASALAEMVSEKEVNEAQALQMARAYLHDTAAKIYSPAR